MRLMYQFYHAAFETWRYCYVITFENYTIRHCEFGSGILVRLSHMRHLRAVGSSIDDGGEEICEFAFCCSLYFSEFIISDGD